MKTKDLSRRRRTAFAGVLAAIALLVAGPITSAEAVESSRVAVTNKQKKPIFLGFSGEAIWQRGKGCKLMKGGVKIMPKATCKLQVTSAGGSRFCADFKGVPNCVTAQNLKLTLIETTFTTTTKGCNGKAPCLYYDISLIPVGCTDQLWKANRCAKTIGASYNLPVELACSGGHTYVCRGPQTRKWGAAMYPSKCGNPNAKTQGGKNGQNAYFYPMFQPPQSAYQPSTKCPFGKVMKIIFLPGK